MSDYKLDLYEWHVSQLASRKAGLSMSQLALVEIIEGQLIRSHGTLRQNDIVSLIQLCDRTPKE
jgi:hypothetical protein